MSNSIVSSENHIVAFIDRLKQYNNKAFIIQRILKSTLKVCWW